MWNLVLMARHHTQSAVLTKVPCIAPIRLPPMSNESCGCGDADEDFGHCCELFVVARSGGLSSSRLRFPLLSTCADQVEARLPSAALHDSGQCRAGSWPNTRADPHSRRPRKCAQRVESEAFTSETDSDEAMTRKGGSSETRSEWSAGSVTRVSMSEEGSVTITLFIIPRPTPIRRRSGPCERFAP
jgi:hypothetical protein